MIPLAPESFYLYFISACSPHDNWARLLSCLKKTSAGRVENLQSCDPLTKSGDGFLVSIPKTRFYTESVHVKRLAQ